jgi:DNA-binding NtrC family response regulator
LASSRETREQADAAIKVLVVDDDGVLARALQRVLTLQGFDVDTALDGRAALAKLESGDYDVMLLDLRMGSMDGMEVYAMRPAHCSPATIVHSAHIDVRTAVAATRAGVQDVMQKPVPEEVLTARIRELALERRAGVQPRAPRAASVNNGDPLASIVGSSLKATELREQVRRVAQFRDVSVLVHGPTGTGKELVAQAVHDLTCATEPFVSVNCAAVPEQLFESELFGHEAGSFTSARSTRVGLFEEAAGGTLFLDEIGEMPQALQAKLLRVLEIRQFRRVGGTRTRVFAARVVSATNRPLTPSLGGAVRPDLFFRLAGYAIRTPALVERLSDVPELAQHFLGEFARRHQVGPIAFSPDAMNALVEHGWPGNVRELRAVVENATIVARRGIIERLDIENALDARGSSRLEIAETWDGSTSPPIESAAERSGVMRAVVAKGPEGPGPRRAPSLPDLQRDLILRAFEDSQHNLSRSISAFLARRCGRGSGVTACAECSRRWR